MHDSNFQNDLNDENNKISTHDGSEAAYETTKNPPRAKKLMLFIVSAVVVLLVAFFVLISDHQTVNNAKFSEINQIAIKAVNLTTDHSAKVKAEIAQVSLENSDTGSGLSNEPSEKEFIGSIKNDAIELAQISLDESDLWLSGKLESLISQKKLFHLVITEELIRRFVIFTDSLTRGEVIYKYSPLQSPEIKFSLNESADSRSEDVVNDVNKTTIKSWQWDKSTTDRFTTYIDLVNALSTEEYMALYTEMKPLIDQVYSELGYPSENFTHTLIDAISHIIDFKRPDKTLALTRTSVMYKYKDESVESLQELDKLLIRLGEQNINKLVPLLENIRDELAQTDK